MPRASDQPEATPPADRRAESPAAPHKRPDLPIMSAADLVNGITDGFLLLDAEWRIVYFNDAAEQLLRPSVDPSTLLGEVIWAAMPATLGTEFERQYRAVAEQRRPAFFDNYYEPWDRWFEIRAFPWSQGGIIIFFHDASERKRIETELRRKARDLRVELAELESIYRRAPLGLAVLDLELRFLRINDHLAEINGLPAEAHIGRSLDEMVPSLVEQVRRVRDQVVETAAPVQVEFEGTTKAAPGVVRHWKETWYPLTNESGQVFALGAVVEEIPEQHIAERRLFDQALQLANAMPQLVWTAGADGEVDYYNERLANYAGAVRRSDGSWEWAPLLHPEDTEPTWKAWRRAVERSTEYSMTHRVKMADGTLRWHLSRAIPLKNERGEVVKWFGTATDIDQQKRVEEQLEAAVATRTARLQETVAELEAFSYSVSHDMRGPLRSMQTYARILETECGEKLGAEGLQFVRRIVASADRLDRLIQDVLAYSKVSRGELPLERVDLGKLIEEIAATYPELQTAAIRVQPQLPRVLANSAALTQCLSNLLSNAVKFVRPGGTPRVEVTGEVEGALVRLRVRDEGCGITAEVQPRLFDMFYQADPKVEGTGIGLPIVRRAAERMGGRAYLESSSPAGSTFVLELRAAP